MAGSNNVITANHQGPLVNIVAWVLMVVMIMAAVTKITNKWYRTRTLMADDYLLLVAMLFAIAQTVTVSDEVANGLGREDALRDMSSFAQYERTAYVSQLLYIITLYLTKATTAWFIRSFAPVQWVFTTTSLLIYGSLGWTIISLLVVAFQCKTPSPWAFIDNECINMIGFWDVYGILDLLTDILLVAVPVAIVAKLQTTRRHRLSVLAPFTLRALTVPLIVLRIVFINATYNSRRASSDEVKAALVTEIHMNFAIILTCVPFIKAVIDALQGGAMTSDLLFGPPGTHINHQRTNFYPLSNLSRPLNGRSDPSQDPKSSSTDKLPENDANRLESARNSRAESTMSPSSENGYRSNRVNSTDIAVHTTITTTMEHW